MSCHQPSLLGSLNQLHNHRVSMLDRFDAFWFNSIAGAEPTPVPLVEKTLVGMRCSRNDHAGALINAKLVTWMVNESLSHVLPTCWITTNFTQNEKRFEDAAPLEKATWSMQWISRVPYWLQLPHYVNVAVARHWWNARFHITKLSGICHVCSSRQPPHGCDCCLISTTRGSRQS